jgi:hypothetical protein
MRATLMPGTFTVTATREGLKPATVMIESKPVEVVDGLSLEIPRTLSPATR